MTDGAGDDMGGDSGLTLSFFGRFFVGRTLSLMGICCMGNLILQGGQHHIEQRK
jgi:hypothetical protein